MNRTKSHRGPQVHVGALQVRRCYVQPIAYEEANVHWSIGGALLPESDEAPNEADPARSHPAWVLVGELVAHGPEGIAAITVDAMCGYASGVTPAFDTPRRELNEVRRLGTQLSDILYDLAADTARQLLTLTRIDVAVPLQTPDAEFEVLRPSDAEELPVAEAAD